MRDRELVAWLTVGFVRYQYVGIILFNITESVDCEGTFCYGLIFMTFGGLQSAIRQASLKRLIAAVLSFRGPFFRKSRKARFVFSIR